MSSTSQTFNGGESEMTATLGTMPVTDVRRKARHDAQDVLSRCWSPGSLPVQPVSVARNLGLSVFSAELGEDVFGMLVGNAGGADIYLDRDQPRLRFRFSCAHEIGHYILRVDDLGPSVAFVDKRSDEDRGSPDEIYANEFAGSLLMPEADLRAAIRGGLDDYELASTFDVSLHALRYRRTCLHI